MDFTKFFRRIISVRRVRGEHRSISTSCGERRLDWFSGPPFGFLPVTQRGVRPGAGPRLRLPDAKFS
ncbi:hypothetical protein [Actinoplanes sp. NPDC049265]|uniref:hypothetical protein n=1 Tax=Actinoplanes sp. NPDC049265 TaxID=3363902 RepID=UPI00371C433F